MPLLKKQAVPLVNSPENLQADEGVWQVRYTKEIFRSYEEYLKRMHLYRQRTWECKVTGKKHLTYEEALLSERKASLKVVRFPKQLASDVLRLVQFSTLPMKDLVAMTLERLKDSFVKGEELLGENDRPCRVLKVLTGDQNPLYQVEWLDGGGRVTNITTEEAQKLVRKKAPFSRDLLRLFIKESTCRSSPWVLHSELAMQHGISTEFPEHLKGKLTKDAAMSKQGFSEAHSVTKTKNDTKRRKELENGDTQVAKKTKTEDRKKLQEKIKYPIDDLLVAPSPHDPVLSERPVPSFNFLVPMENVGELLMIWDFCSSFGRLLHLYPFSLEDFENAIAYEGNSNLIVELHYAFLSLLVNESEDFSILIKQKKRNLMVTSKNWLDYLCDFLEFEEINSTSGELTKIKRGQYYSIGVYKKIEILGALVHWSLSTDSLRDQLDTHIERHQGLLATKREEDMEEARQKREKQMNEMKAKETLQENNIPGSTWASGLNGTFAPEKRGNDEISVSRVLIEHNPEVVESMHNGERTRVAELKRLQEERKARETLRTAELKRLQEERRVKEREAKERRQKEQREEQFKREVDKLFIRTNPIGRDRDRNRYWFFHREGRLFVEGSDHKNWGYYSCKEELDGLMGSLNPKGERERSLKIQLEKHYPKICAALQKRSREVAQKVTLDTSVLRRSIRVSVPRTNDTQPFLTYVNKWRE